MLRAQMYRKNLLLPCFPLVCSLPSVLKFWVDKGSPCPLKTGCSEIRNLFPI